MLNNFRNWLDIRVLIGIGIIGAGLLLLLQNFGFHLHFRIWDLWPLILILVGIGHLTGQEETRQPMTAAILIIIGAVFLSNNLDLIDFHFNIWPIILVLIGIAILKHSFVGSKTKGTDSDFIHLSFFLGGGDYNYSTKTLEGGKIAAIMGGGTIDLRQCDIKGEEIIIEVFAFWGGFDIRVPHEWRVNVQATPIMGGMDNKCTPPAEGYANGKRIVVRGMAIMGGVEVKN